jgi:hypothetical protein
MRQHPITDVHRSSDFVVIEAGSHKLADSGLSWCEWIEPLIEPIHATSLRPTSRDRWRDERGRYLASATAVRGQTRGGRCVATQSPSCDRRWNSSFIKIDWM